jgi:hypothetical protein
MQWSIPLCANVAHAVGIMIGECGPGSPVLEVRQDMPTTHA